MKTLLAALLSFSGAHVYMRCVHPLGSLDRAETYLVPSKTTKAHHTSLSSARSDWRGGDHSLHASSTAYWDSSSEAIIWQISIGSRCPRIPGRALASASRASDRSHRRRLSSTWIGGKKEYLVARRSSCGRTGPVRCTQPAWHAAAWRWGQPALSGQPKRLCGTRLTQVSRASPGWAGIGRQQCPSFPGVKCIHASNSSWSWNSSWQSPHSELMHVGRSRCRCWRAGRGEDALAVTVYSLSSKSLMRIIVYMKPAARSRPARSHRAGPGEVELKGARGC